MERHEILEHRAEMLPGARSEKWHCYRKTPLFDRFLTFNIRTEPPESARH
jgi:hypothetical protein